MATLTNMSDPAMAAWNRLAQSWGSPLNMTSAYRTPEYNASVGGASGSQHIHGNAFDVSTAGMSPEDRAALIQAAQAAGFTGFGGYDTSLHFDVGPSRTWGSDYSSGSTPSWLSEAIGGTPRTQISTSGISNMAMNQPQSSGLLNYFGIQERDPMAQGQDALPFYQRDRFKDTMGNLAMAFNSMRMNPDANLPAAMQRRQATRQMDQRSNRTIEWLRSQPNGNQAVAMIEAGADPAAAIQWLNEQNKPSESYSTLSGQQLLDSGVTGANPNALYKINNVTGEVSQVGGPATQINMGQELEPFEKSMQENQAKFFTDLANGASGAFTTLGQVDRLDALLAQGGSGFGPALAAGIKNITGIDLRDDAAAAAEALISQLVPAQRPTGSGTMSDADLALYKASLPQLSLSPEGNQLILEGMRALAQYNIALSRISMDVMGGRISRDDGYAKILELGNPLEEVTARIRSGVGAGSPASTGGAPTFGGTTDTGVEWKVTP